MPSTGPRNVQPSSKPGNVMGRQAMKPKPTVSTGADPANTISPLVGAGNAAVPRSASVGEAPVGGGLSLGGSPSERAAEIARSDSPLMRQAGTAGKQYAAERGLLNSSVAAGAAQGAVLDRAGDFARADADNELQRFYAGLDRDRFDSDVEYRDRELAQEKALQDRKLSLDEELGRGRLSFDKQRFASDEVYRRDVLAQEEKIATTRLDFDRERFRSDEGYRRDVLAQQATLERERLTFDRERFASDEGYRDRQLAQEAHFAGQRLDFDKDRFRSDVEYRSNVLAQEKEFETRRLDLVQEENEFRRTLDQQRFDNDVVYRDEVLKHQRWIENRRADLELDRLAFDREGLAQNEIQSRRNNQTSLLAIRQDALNRINANPDMAADDREDARGSVNDDYVSGSDDLNTLSDTEVVFDDTGAMLLPKQRMMSLPKPRMMSLPKPRMMLS